jgi:sRNA-binding regulator protein Hfq
MKTILLFLSLLLVFGASAYAESVYLKDGTVLRGTITEEDDKTILLETNDTWRKIDKSTVEFIRKDDRPWRAQPEATKKEIEGSWQTVVKIAADVAGRHAYSNVKIDGNPDVPHRGSSSIGTGISLTAEEFHAVSPTVALGAGISYQTARKEPTSGGEFSFVPIYGLLRVRSTPTGDDRYTYAIAQFGYNYFIADGVYVGAGYYTMTNGAYAGLGVGRVFGNMQVEALYTIDQGKMSGHDVSSGTPYSVSADATYRKLSLSIGYLF